VCGPGPAYSCAFCAKCALSVATDYADIPDRYVNGCECRKMCHALPSVEHGWKEQPQGDTLASGIGE
jgi:hypothetical protein